MTKLFINLNPLQLPLNRGRAVHAPPLKRVSQAIRVADARTRGGWEGFDSRLVSLRPLNFLEV